MTKRTSLELSPTHKHRCKHLRRAGGLTMCGLMFNQWDVYDEWCATHGIAKICLSCKNRLAAEAAWQIFGAGDRLGH